MMATRGGRHYVGRPFATRPARSVARARRELIWKAAAADDAQEIVDPIHDHHPSRCATYIAIGAMTITGGLVRPLVSIGIALIVCGIVLVAMRGISYTKERQSVQVGPVQVAAERKGFVPPVAGVAAIIVGGVLVLAGRRRA